MASEKESVKRSIVMPAELVEKPLFDADGNRWTIRLDTGPLISLLPNLVPLSSKKLVAEKSPQSAEKSLGLLLKEHSDHAMRTWIEKDVLPKFGSLTEEVKPLLQECITIGERNFRKELVAKLGARGASVWKTILEEQFEEIAKSWKSEQESGESVIFSGALPPNTRFHWRIKKGESVYDVFCLEFPPQKRTVNISFGHPIKYHLAFPWFCFLVCFENGQLLHLNHDGYDGFWGFWAFYRPESLKSESDALYFPNLPNINSNWPYHWCLGGSMPPLSLNDHLWHQKLLSWFWDSEFGGVLTYFIVDAQKRIPEVNSMSKWQKLSKDCPERMLTLPWLKVNMNLKEFVAVLSEKFLVGGGRSKKKGGRDKAAKTLVKKFQERLTEELHFLGSHFSLPIDLRSEVEKGLGGKVGDSASDLGDHLKWRCEVVAEKTLAEFLKGQSQ